MLATQSIEARAQQEGCRQACTIGLSINEDTKLEKGKEKRKTGGAVGLYKYLARAAKALVVTETTVENSTIQYGNVPDSIKQYMP
jgi:hypothetical protein